VENSPLFQRPALSDDLRTFVAGYAPGRMSPARLAWTLEHAAVARGWPVGSSLGSERELIDRFGVSRETLREAVRVVEARGSMRMQRGCKGGLRLVRTDVDRVAGAFATYLRAVGCDDDEWSRTLAAAGPYLAELPGDDPIVDMLRRTRALFETRDNEADGDGARAPRIAIRIIRYVGGAIPAAGVPLGSEAALCDRFGACRSTFRQVFGILDDLGMLQVRRGRGGGYALKPPTPMGFIRQMFALLASRHQTIQASLPQMWALNLANLQLAGHAIDRLDADARALWCDRLLAMLAEAREPGRWALLQLMLGRIAGGHILRSLLGCLIAYQGRLGAPPAPFPAWDEHLHDLEEGIVGALRRGAADDAERLQRGAQACLSGLLGDA
jgi:DNA-binding FadR family transcriptional regulator